MLNIVKYLLSSPDLKEHANIHADNNYGIRWACENGHLEVIKQLLASPELKEHADVHTDNDYGFSMACFKGHLEVVKYLLASPELKEHADIHAGYDCGFRWACERSHSGVIDFLIFDMNIEKTKAISDFLKNDKYNEIDKLFKIRDVNNKLSGTILQSKDKKKNKI